MLRIDQIVRMINHIINATMSPSDIPAIRAGFSEIILTNSFLYPLVLSPIIEGTGVVVVRYRLISPCGAGVDENFEGGVVRTLPLCNPRNPWTVRKRLLKL